MAFITDTPFRPLALAQRLLARLGLIAGTARELATPAPVDGAKAQAARTRREEARRAVDNLLR